MRNKRKMKTKTENENDTKRHINFRNQSCIVLEKENKLNMSKFRERGGEWLLNVGSYLGKIAFHVPCPNSNKRVVRAWYMEWFWPPSISKRNRLSLTWKVASNSLVHDAHVWSHCSHRLLVRVEKKTKKRELKNTISKRNDIRIRFERRIKWASKTNQEAHNVDHEAKSK